MIRSIRDIRNDQREEDRALEEAITNRFAKEGYNVDVQVDTEVARISLMLGRDRSYHRVLLPEKDIVDFTFNRLKDRMEARRNIHNMDEALD